MSCGITSDAEAFARCAEWLSAVFIAQPTSEQVTQMAMPASQNTLYEIGERLEAQAEVQTLCQWLVQESPDALVVTLQRRYTALFEGIFRHRAVLPYESAWQASGNATTLGGTPVVEMAATLRSLDLHVSSTCCEPPDHLAIELAALAAALRTAQDTVARALVERLQAWVPQFGTALTHQDPGGFYAAAGDLLRALIRECAVALKMKAAATPTTERHSGAFA